MEETAKTHVSSPLLRVAEAVAQAIIVALVMWLVSSTLDVLYGDRGYAIVGPVSVEADQKWRLLEIANHGTESIDNLRVEVPGLDGALTIKTIPSTKLVTVNSGSSSVIEIQDIAPSRITYIYIPIENDQTDVSVLNARERRLSVMTDRTLPSNTKRALQDGLTTALVGGVLYLLLAFWWERRFESTSKVLQQQNEVAVRSAESALRSTELIVSQLSKQTDAGNAEIAGLREDLHDEKRAEFQFRAVTFRKLKHYETELDFWRDTIRKCLVDANISERLISGVTETLRTYGTLNKEVDLKALRALASDLGASLRGEESGSEREVK